MQDFQNKNRLTITSTRVCKQELELPNGVYVVSSDAAAADLSSSAMFTQSQVPYLFSTACSDGVVRFWSCRELKSESESFEFHEWQLNSTLNENPSDYSSINKSSQLHIENFPLALSCSYNGRFAVAYKKNTGLSKNDLKGHTFTDFYVKIFECESTGGSAWKLEDSISLKSIVLPELDSGINLDYIYGNQKPIKPAFSTHSFKNMLLNNTLSSISSNSNLTSLLGTSSVNGNGVEEVTRAPEIPSSAAKISIKRQFSINGLQSNTKFEPAIRKKLIKLDWASTENGSHLLTVCLGNQVFVYSCVKKEKIESVALKPKSVEAVTTKVLLGDSRLTKLPEIEENKLGSSVGEEDSQPSESIVKWVQFRSFTLDSADDLQALPTQIKWVRDGLLVVGLDTEMQVYSQWNPPAVGKEIPAGNEEKAKVFEIKPKEPNSLKTNILVSKNHSVADLNKLNKMANEKLTGKTSKNKKKETEKVDTKSLLSSDIPAHKVYDENQILDIIQDSGLFMQAK